MIKKEDVKKSNDESVSEVIVRGIEKLKLEKEMKQPNGTLSAEQQLRQAIETQKNLNLKLII